MKNKELLNELKDFRACSDAVEWVNGLDFKTSWETCERADWMLWYIVKKKISIQSVRSHIICDCAETALKYVPKGEDRPRKAIEAARRYVDNPTQKNKDAACAAADAAAYAADAASAAAYAAYAAADTAAYAAYAAADAAAHAACATAYAAADAASAAVNAANVAACAAGRKQAHIQMCNIIRNKIKPNFEGV